MSTVHALAFTGDAFSLDLPDITPDPTGGLGLKMWLYRKGPQQEQRILRLGSQDGAELILETGAEPDTLVLAQVRGGQRWQLVARGALPQGRWVPLRIAVAADGAASLEVFGLRAASGSLTPLGQGPRTGNSFAGATPRSRFIGSCVDLQIYRHGRMADGDLWAAYPLSEAKLERTEVLRGGTIRRNHYLIEDRSAKGRHLRTTADPTVETYDGALFPPGTPALRFAAAGKGLRLSPIRGMSKGLTMEVWLRPSTAGQARAVMSLGFPSSSLTLSAGDAEGSAALSLSGGNPLFRGKKNLLTVKGVVQKDAWTHLAATVKRDGFFFEVAIYQNGQLRGQARTLVQSVAVPSLDALAQHCNLGGGGGGLPGFAGALAEARLFTGALSEAEIGARWLTRASGDEPGLVACYPLDQQEHGCLFDISPRRGTAVLENGGALEGADRSGPPLPLLSPALTAPVRIAATGKLLREWIQLDLGQGRLAPRQQVNVFDATLEPRSASGQSFLGQEIEVRLDQPMEALRSTERGTSREPWSQGQSYRVPVSSSGVLRLRFIARDLGCPTIRVRVAGAAGAWTVVRPDLSTLRSLREVSKAGLQRPADGRPSPLPPGTSDADAEALAAAMSGLARALPPGPPRRTLGTARGAFSWAEDAWDATTEGVGSAVDAVGGLDDAIADLGQDAIREATRLPKTAGQLVVRAGAELDALVEKARQVPARIGRDAIRTYLGAADTLAVVSGAGINQLVHNLEIVGTSLVRGSKVVWRLVVSGVNDAVAAIGALIERIGAQIDKFLEYLAYLFNWGDILRACDEAYGYCERALGALPGQLAALDGHRRRFTDALDRKLEGSFLGKSMAEICGLKVNADTPGLDELNYVIEKVQEVMSVADSLAAKATAGVAREIAGDPNEMLARGNAIVGALPLSTVENPVALLTTPLSGLLSSAAGLSQSSGGLLDSAFQTIKERTQEALDAGTKLLKDRLYVPGLTPFIEEVILGGRQLSVLRAVALCAAICKVLTDKLTRSVQNRAARAARLDRSLTARGETSPAETRAAPTSAQPTYTPFEIWVPTAFDMINTLVVGIQTGLEIAAARGTQADAAAKKTQAWLSGLSILSGILILCKGSMWIGLAATKQSRLRDYTMTVSILETFCGGWLVISGLARAGANAKIWAPLLDVMDPILLTLGMLGIIGTSAAPIALGYVNEDEKAQYGLKAGAWGLTSLARALSAYDDHVKNPKFKGVTVAFLLASGAADVTAAIYGYSSNPPRT